jgi:glutathione synthase/RimK-type ligase-like ATP-grasp enzyme
VPSICLVTCSTLAGLDPDDQLLLAPLRALGVEPVARTWDDPAVDWAAFDLTVIRSTWDYPARRDEFVAWTRRVPRLVNPADVIEWNTDKRYLADLAAAGIATVPTTWLEPGESLALPSSGRHVLKPSIGAGSKDVAAFSLHVEHEASLAREHAQRLQSAGTTVMVQPYVEHIEELGETALMFVDGEFSHAVSKGAMLAGKRDLVDGLYFEETIAPTDPTEAELDLGRRALATVPGGPDRLAYARVDLVPDSSGAPLLMELELTEPSLFMKYAPGSPERFARVLSELTR